MHRAVGEPVDVAAGHLEHADPLVAGGAQRLADAVVDVDALRDVQRRRGDVRAQALDDRVAPDDDLGSVGSVPPGGGAPAAAGRPRRHARAPARRPEPFSEAGRRGAGAPWPLFPVVPPPR